MTALLAVFVPKESGTVFELRADESLGRNARKVAIHISVNIKSQREFGFPTYQTL
jgi:hypothetical protein